MAVVVSAVSALLQKLGEPLIQEAIFLYGVNDQVEWIEGELRRMQCFLEDAEAKQEADKRVQNWVQDVRDVAYDAEDVIDTFVSKLASSRHAEFKSSIKRFAFLIKKLITRHKIGWEIERIKHKICAISESRSTYGIESIGTSSASQSRQEWRVSSPNVEEPDFVGFEKDLEILVGRLIEGELRRSVVSVVGMGGLGKTTLAKQAYNCDSIKKHFISCGWIFVSQEYSVKDLLQDIIKCFVSLSEREVEKMEKMKVVELRHMISDYLRERRYLIVLDDIWKNEAWDALKDAFPDSNNGSRILFTTRNKGVALHADARSLPYELRFLEEGESWELFCKKAFPGQDTNCPLELETSGRKIVEKCHGLPLAIVVIGGLLSTKESSEWENVLKSISWQFVKGEVRIYEILSLSYKDLPHYLKPCFLYLGIFVEDSEFPADKLVRLWSAEGFLEQRGDLTLEEVGEVYLKELIQRSMIQIAKRNSRGEIKSCRIHDLLRDLSISKAKEDKFLEVHHGLTSSPSALRARRLAIHGAVAKCTSLNFSASHLRSVLLFTHDYEYLAKKQLKIFCGGFKLLRVLDLHHIRMHWLPSEIGALIHLRYLQCDHTRLYELPSSIGRLYNLQTLNVTSETRIIMPSTIEKMQHLRHLRLKLRTVSTDGTVGKLRSCLCSEISGHPQLDQLSDLQTLTRIKAGDWIYSCLGKLPNLKKLAIYLNSVAYAEVCYEFIVKLDCLRFLSMSTKDGSEIQVVVPPAHLHKLWKLSLRGRLEKLPEPSEFPMNLTKLTLRRSYLEHDPLVTLERLNNLRTLILGYKSYVGKKMLCSSTGFPRLEFLHIESLLELAEWIVEGGSMPRLLHLRIERCKKLKMVPVGLRHVPTLKKLELWNVEKEFIARLQDDDAEDWHEIQNIPSIDICKADLFLSSFHESWEELWD